VKPLRILGGLYVLLLLLMAGCSEELATSADPNLIPVEAETFEVLLPFEQFATEYRVDRGFGFTQDLPTVTLANNWGESLSTRVLFRYLNFPDAITAQAPGSLVGVVDSAFVAVGGRMLLVMDPASSAGPETMQIELASVSEEWDPQSATWTLAVDTVGDRRPWNGPGGGALQRLAGSPWSPSPAPDTVTLRLDSMVVREWLRSDTSGSGLILRSLTPNSKLRIRNLSLIVDVRPSINADTLVQIRPTRLRTTTLYTPEPAFGAGVLPVGGSPAYRSTFRFALPDSVAVQGPRCGAQPTCRVALTSPRVVYAGLRLHPTPTVPRGLAPLDSLNLEIRPVLAPERLPQSPLGFPVLGQPFRVGPGDFLNERATAFELPLTRYLRSVIDGEDFRKDPVNGVVSLLTFPEPASLGIATFAAPGTARRPVLRIILTVSEGVQLP